MLSAPSSLRPFIGAKNYELCIRFYTQLGFTQTVIDAGMCLFSLGSVHFYLQNAYVKDWVDNTMLFLEVDDLDKYYDTFLKMQLGENFPGARLHPIVQRPWGSEFFLHDPSAVLWHIGNFNK